jgi:hypothetical protein
LAGFTVGYDHVNCFLRHTALFRSNTGGWVHGPVCCTPLAAITLHIRYSLTVLFTLSLPFSLSLSHSLFLSLSLSLTLSLSLSLFLSHSLSLSLHLCVSLPAHTGRFTEVDLTLHMRLCSQHAAAAVSLSLCMSPLPHPVHAIQNIRSTHCCR